jgi:malonyl-CoA/methylmalonyl-CoA synthetase
MNLLNLFDLSLQLRAGEVALEWRGACYTFGELEARSNRAANWLRERGLGKGDRLGVYLANCVELIDLYLACVKTGVIFVPINILYREREITHIVKDARPSGVVTRADDFPGGVPVWRPEEIGEGGEERPGVMVDGDDIAALVYTSGTTGASKGAMITHNNLAANALNLITCWQMSSSDRLLLALPLFHVHALGNGLHTWLIAGYRMRLLERFEARRAEEEFQDFEPTLFFGVPTMYVRLLEIAPEVARRMARRMRLFVSGSAPLPAQVLEEFEQRFGHRILERYGMTETMMNISNPYVGERRAGTVGLPLPGVSVKLLDGEGREVGVGETGEVHLKGANVFAGYWRQPEATAEAFRDGWFRTGDIGVRSADGYYTLRGRKSDLIISGGYNIYPREIEELLLEQEGVAEAAVVGAPDAVKGEVPVAYVVLREGGDVEQLEAVCRAKLAPFKAPRAFVRVDALPRTALGKVQKHLLVKP